MQASRVNARFPHFPGVRRHINNLERQTVPVPAKRRRKSSGATTGSGRRKNDKVMTDGAYDGAPTYQTIVQYGDDIEVLIPPRKTAVPGNESRSPSQRDRHLDMLTTASRLS